MATYYISKALFPTQSMTAANFSKSYAVTTITAKLNMTTALLQFTIQLNNVPITLVLILLYYIKYVALVHIEHLCHCKFTVLSVYV